MFDAHIHLDQYENIEKHIDRWLLAGVSGVIAVSTDLKSSYRTLELHSKYPHFIHAAIGFHPERPLPSVAEFIEWQNLLKSERDQIVAVGEIGLPHYTLTELPHSIDHSLNFLANCLEISSVYDLPVVLHAVHDKSILAYHLLKKHSIQSAHFHWLKAPLEVVELIISDGYYISFTPEVCYRARDQQLAKIVPLSQLLIETDGPWRFGDRFKDVETSPLLLAETIQTLSLLKGQEKQSLIRQINQNTISFYQL